MPMSQLESVLQNEIGSDWRQRVLELDPEPLAAASIGQVHSALDTKGNESRTDYVKALKLVLDAGYRGYVGIEYEGGKLSEVAGVHATKKLLLKVRETLS